MQTALIAMPHLYSATTGKGESLADLEAVLAPTSSSSSSNKRLLQMEQVHSAEVAVIEKNVVLNTFARKPASTTQLPGVDAIITAIPTTLLVVRTADCVPIVLAHPSGVVGVIHAGRKGTQAGILQKTLRILKHNWSITKDLHTWIGPHICAECYEVNRETGAHYDLLTENLRQLHAEFGPETISLTLDGRCTAHQNTELYSYRAEGAGVPMNYAGVTFKNA